MALVGVLALAFMSLWRRNGDADSDCDGRDDNGINKTNVGGASVIAPDNIGDNAGDFSYASRCTAADV